MKMKLERCNRLQKQFYDFVICALLIYCVKLFVTQLKFKSAFFIQTFKKNKLRHILVNLHSIIWKVLLFTVIVITSYVC